METFEKSDAEKYEAYKRGIGELEATFVEENIVYILGAGFSAPLGLPVIKDFYGKSQELQRRHSKQYEYFDKVFNFVKGLAQVSAYYKGTDILNIEQALSILEMKSQLDNTDDKELMKKYIKAVIKEFTPPITPKQESPINPMNRIFRDSRWYPYGAFIGTIFHLKFRSQKTEQNANQDYIFDSYQWLEAENSYSVITFNYDCVLEIMCEFVNQVHLPTDKLGFCREWQELMLAPGNVYLAKLHGSVGEGEDIIPPTSRKDFANESILASWKLARQLLRNANQIRIIGYSLPTPDSYFKDLLRVAAIDATNLKWIDVLCKDPEGEVKKRYEDLIGNNERLRFRSADVKTYLWNLQYSSGDSNEVYFNFVEDNHRRIFEESQ